MRIAIVGPTKSFGGISVHVRELSKGLRIRGDEVVVVPKKEANMLSSSAYYLSSLLRDFDIVHVQGFQNFQPLIASLAAKKLLGRYSVATAHGFGGESRWWYSSTQRHLMRSILRQFDMLVSISSYVQNRLSRFTGLSPPKLVTIYNGVDTSFFDSRLDATDFRRKIGLEKDFVVLYVGRLAWNKGIPDLITGIDLVRKRISNVRLIICGKGRMEKELKEQVERLGLQKHVRFTSLVPQEELPLYYALSDVVAVPSIFEPFGIVLLEAMSMCRPVIATRVGGIPEAVKDGETGLLIPPRAPESITEAILTLNADDALRKKLGENGRRLVERQFTFEKMAERTWQCYRSIPENSG